jgi:hypothetical protein
VKLDEARPRLRVRLEVVPKLVPELRLPERDVAAPPDAAVADVRRVGKWTFSSRGRRSESIAPKKCVIIARWNEPGQVVGAVSPLPFAYSSMLNEWTWRHEMRSSFIRRAASSYCGIGPTGKMPTKSPPSSPAALIRATMSSANAA